MRTITAILFLSCLMVVTVGYHLSFNLQLYQWKSAVKRTLAHSRSRKDLVTLSFTPDQLGELNWEDSREFRWKGEWYDVVELKRGKERVVITCVTDKKEKELLQEYSRKMEKRGSPGQRVVVKLMDTRFTITDLSLPDRPQSTLLAAYPPWSAFIPLGFLDTVIQPPEWC